MLKSVQMSSEGSYLCEVSGEAPLFQTAKMQNFLKVVGKLHSLKDDQYLNDFYYHVKSVFRH